MKIKLKKIKRKLNKKEKFQKIDFLDGKMGLNGEISSVIPSSKSLKNLRPDVNWSSMKVATNAVVQYTDLPEQDLGITVSGRSLAYRSVIELALAKFFNFASVKYRIKKINDKFYETFDLYLSQVSKR